MTPAQKKAAEEKMRQRGLASPLFWFATFALILDKARQQITPVPNIAQIRFSEVVEYCLAKNIPCRIVMVKPRKVGISTFAVATAYWLMRKWKMFAAILADKEGRSDILFEILRFIAEHDGLRWDDGIVPTFTNTQMKLGDEPDASHAEKFTAGNPNATIGETPQILVATEAAHYPKGGAMDGTKTMTNTLNSIPKKPRTFVFVESTASGREGFFPPMWENARWPDFLPEEEHYWEDYKDGKSQGDSGFFRVFVAWWEMEEYQLEVTQEQRDFIDRTLTMDEKRGIQDYGWTHEQIAWRRDTIKNECLGKENNFKRDFPSSPDEPFTFSGSPRFDVNGMLYMNSIKGNVQGSYGVLSEVDPVRGGRPTFVPTEPGQAWFRCWEKPKEGCKYIIASDIADDRDMNPASSDDNEVKRDRHAAFVIRAGYLDNRNVRHRPMVVGRIVPPCRDGHELLAKKIQLMSVHYGGCPVVIEMNNHGLNVAKLLRDIGANLLISRSVNPLSGAMIENYGHRTTEANRLEVIEKLDKAFRTVEPVPDQLGGTYVDPDALLIYCEHALEECGTFMIDKRGKAQASAANHDDDVMGIAIAYFYVASATPYTERIVERKIPKWDYHVDQDDKGKPKGPMGV